MNIDYQISIIVNIYLAIAIFQSIKPLPQLTINEKIETLNIKFLRNGEVALSDRAAVLSYSTNCSDIYGDAIHLARTMANTFDGTYFDVNDGCLQNVTPRYDKEQDTTPEVNVYPNPTSGVFSIEFSERFSGIAQLYNTEGRLIKSLEIKDSYSYDLDLTSHSGLFNLRLTSVDGTVITRKVVILK